MLGKIIEYGVSPYNFDENEADSFFIKIKFNSTTKTLWSIGLQEALIKSGAVTGDKIKVKLLGQTPVTLPCGRKAHRNSYDIHKVSNSQIHQNMATKPQVKNKSNKSNKSSSKTNSFSFFDFCCVAVTVFVVIAASLQDTSL